MTRHAKFVINGNVELEIETFGQKAQNDGIFPEKAEVRFYVTPQSCISHSFEISDAGLFFDVNLHEEVRRDVDGDIVDNSTMVDETSGNTKVSIKGNPYPTESYKLPPRPFFTSRTIFLIVFNLVGILLLIYLYLRSRRKNRLVA
jgi:hypothetical protein